MLLSNNKYGVTVHNKLPLFWILSGFIIGLIYIFRDYSVGTDTIQYAYEFNNPRTKNIEVLWLYLNLAINYLGGSFRVLLFVVFILYWTTMSKTVKRLNFDKKHSFLALTIFLCLCVPDAFNVMRQCLAGALWTYCFAKCQLNDKPFRKELIATTIILGTLHTSVFLLLVLVWVDILLINRKGALIIWLLSIFVIISGSSDIITFLLLYAGSYMPSGILAEVQDNYLSAESILANVASRNYYTALLLNVPVMISLVYYKKIIENKRLCILFNAIFVLQIIVNISFTFEVFNRLREYMYFLEILYIPLLVQTIYIQKNKVSHFYYYGFLILYVSYFLKTFYLGTSNGLFNV